MLSERIVKKAALVMAVAVLTCCSFACSGPGNAPAKDKQEEESLVPPPDVSKRPFVAADFFLKSVRAQKYKEAYAILGVDAKMGVSLHRFEEGMNSYFSMASTKSSYVTRFVADEQSYGDVSIIKVADSKYPDADPWIWEFEKTRAGWKIRSLDLPPLFVYKAKKKFYN